MNIENGFISELLNQEDSKDHFLVTKKEYQSPSLKSALEVFTNLYSNLKRREEIFTNDLYSPGLFYLTNNRALISVDMERLRARSYYR